MDSGERRRQAAATARLGFLGIALVAALLAVLQLLRGVGGGEQQVVAAPAPGWNGASAELDPALAGRLDRLAGGGAASPQSAALLAAEGPAEPLHAAPWELIRAHDAALGARVREHISKALAEAEKRSKGKVSASNTTIAVHIVRPAKNAELLSLASDESLLPASNMKLVTTAAALVLLGADWHFETRFESAAEIAGGHLRGDLVVHAGGDPLYDPDAGGEAVQLLEPVVRDLRRSGIETIDGDLVLDEGSYLEPGPGPGWPSENQYWQEHCARAAGFTANGGCLTANVRAGQVGATAPSDVRPRAHGLTRVGNVKTVAAGARLDVAVGAVPGRVTLRGKFPASLGPWSDRFAAPDPVELFASVLGAALEQGGVRLAGHSVRRRNLPPARLLASLRTPLAEALYPINLDSNNAIADQLFFALGDALGGGGTRAGGEAATRRALELLGVPHEGLVQVDGSGLSRDSRITARQLTALLTATAALDERAATLFHDTLPVAGESGSLERRMREAGLRGRVHAKTGWIEGASALSGFAETAGGERLVFSILVAYPRAPGLNTHCWKPMQDAICADLVAWHE